jgi:hypothetical protein
MIEHTQHIDEVDHFLAAVKVLFSFDEIGNVVATERIQIGIRLGQGAEQ